jgi:hypothetical protein
MNQDEITCKSDSKSEYDSALKICLVIFTIGSILLMLKLNSLCDFVGFLLAVFGGGGFALSAVGSGIEQEKKRRK